MTWAIWITGLPGSGKSTVTKELLNLLKKYNIKARYLNLDKVRKRYVKNPKYTSKERDFVYKRFAEEGLKYLDKENVIYDATAHKLKYRNYVRNRVKDFIEVYIKCPLGLCIERESKRNAMVKEMYKKAIIRKVTGKSFPELGEVIGIDVKYEENKDAEVIIDSSKIQPKDAAMIILKCLLKKISKE